MNNIHILSIAKVNELYCNIDLWFKKTGLDKSEHFNVKSLTFSVQIEVGNVWRAYTKLIFQQWHFFHTYIHIWLAVLYKIYFIVFAAPRRQEYHHQHHHAYLHHIWCILMYIYIQIIYTYNSVYTQSSLYYQKKICCRFNWWPIVLLFNWILLLTVSVVCVCILKISVNRTINESDYYQSNTLLSLSMALSVSQSVYFMCVIITNFA